MMARHLRCPGAGIGASGLFLALIAAGPPPGATPAQFGGAYAQLDARRQALVADWVERFNRTTGQPLAPAPFYDEILGLSAKTTFEAVTHALMTTPLTDASGRARRRPVARRAGRSGAR